MSTIYNIKFKEGSKKLDMLNITMEKAIDYRMENADEFANGDATFEAIEPKAKEIVVKKDDIAEYNEAKQKYFDELSAIDIQLIKSGKKKVCHNQGTGFYLREVKGESNETFNISLSQVENARKKDMKEYLITILIAESRGKVMEWDSLEVEYYIKEIFSAHKI